MKHLSYEEEQVPFIINNNKKGGGGEGGGGGIKREEGGEHRFTASPSFTMVWVTFKGIFHEAYIIVNSPEQVVFRF